MAVRWFGFCSGRESLMSLYFHFTKLEEIIDILPRTIFLFAMNDMPEFRGREGLDISCDVGGRRGRFMRLIDVDIGTYRNHDVGSFPRAGAWLLIQHEPTPKAAEPTSSCHRAKVYLASGRGWF